MLTGFQACLIDDDNGFAYIPSTQIVSIEINPDPLFVSSYMYIYGFVSNMSTVICIARLYSVFNLNTL